MIIDLQHIEADWGRLPPFLAVPHSFSARLLIDHQFTGFVAVNYLRNMDFRAGGTTIAQARDAVARYDSAVEWCRRQLPPDHQPQILPTDALSDHLLALVGLKRDQQTVEQTLKTHAVVLHNDEIVTIMARTTPTDKEMADTLRRDYPNGKLLNFLPPAEAFEIIYAVKQRAKENALKNPLGYIRSKT